MTSLFIDTTQGITVGIIDENYKWSHYDFSDSNKSSSIVHKMIQDAILEAGNQLSEIKNFIQVSGPGSYTGMRVSDGISQVFAWQDIKVYSFHHFQVPKILNVEQGIWCAKAFKGEIFCYQWLNEKNNSFLIKEANLESSIKNERNIYTSINHDFFPNGFEINKTAKLIKENPEQLFSYIFRNNLNEPLYYFRTIEEEFSKGKQN